MPASAAVWLGSLIRPGLIALDEEERIYLQMPAP